MDNISQNKPFKPVPVTTTAQILTKHRVQALLVRSTDQYFNEYVPKLESVRAHLTNFDGSVGDAIITRTAAYLFVDGRYALQAKQQAADFVVHVTDAAQSIESCWLSKLPELIGADAVLAYDPTTIDLKFV